MGVEHAGHEHAGHEHVGHEHASHEHADLSIVASTTSTNDDAKELGRIGAAHGTCVVAREQTAGRGRRGHTWRSPKGGMYLSILLRPEIPMSMYVGLPAVCAMGIVDVLRLMGASDAQIKWPNDIVLSDGKLAGMLVEAGFFETGPFAVCGIGINVYRREDSANAEGDTEISIPPLTPVYLAEKLDRIPGFKNMATLLRDCIVARVDTWAAMVAEGRANAGPLAPILSDYFDMLSGLGKQVRGFSPEGAQIAEGRFAGIDTWGRATIVTADGQELEFSSEQASLRELENSQT